MVATGCTTQKPMVYMWDEISFGWRGCLTINKKMEEEEIMLDNEDEYMESDINATNKINSNHNINDNPKEFIEEESEEDGEGNSASTEDEVDTERHYTAIPTSLGCDWYHST